MSMGTECDLPVFVISQADPPDMTVLNSTMSVVEAVVAFNGTVQMSRYSTFVQSVLVRIHGHAKESNTRLVDA